jgi:hypothetical protein
MYDVPPPAVADYEKVIDAEPIVIDDERETETAIETRLLQVAWVL